LFTLHYFFKEIHEIGENLKPLFSKIKTHVPQPNVDKSAPFSMLASILTADSYLGRILIGKVYSGSAKVGDIIKSIDLNGKIIENTKLTKLFGFKGIEKIPIEIAEAGDIVAISGIEKTSVADTICNSAITIPIQSTPIDPPTMAITISVNSSPLAGLEGSKVTSRIILARLEKEAESNITITLKISENGENFEIGSQPFTKEETLQLLEKEAVSFSPNVVLRPLYQEYVLPNLCYVGGVGELSYWLQFKSTFEAAGVPFPMIQARTSIVWIDVQTNEKINAQALSTIDLFKSVNDLKQSYLQNNAEEEIDFSLLNFQFEQFKTDLTQKTENIDASINSWMGAEFARMEKQFDGMKSRLEKSVKSKHEKGLKSIEQIKEKLFPNGGMQERTLNFFQMCPDGNYKQKLIDLYEAIEPFNDAVLVLTD
jgi:hypothetical protein